LAKAAYSSSTLHNADQLTDFSVYIECDKFCLIIACERKRYRHSTRHKRGSSFLNTLQRVWQPFYLQHRLTTKNSIYSCSSCLIYYFSVCPVHSYSIHRASIANGGSLLSVGTTFKISRPREGWQ